MSEILFLAHRVPFPPDRGDKIRSNRIVRALAEIAPVHIATFAERQADREAEPHLAELAKSHCLADRTISDVRAGLQALATGQPVSVTAFASRKLADYVSGVLASRPISLIYVFSGQMAQYVPADFAGRAMMDFVDLDSEKFAGYAARGGAMAWVDAREARLLRAYEARTAGRVDISYFVSQDEANLFTSQLAAPMPRVEALGNGIDTVFYDPACVAAARFAATPGPHILFTGQMDYRPNVEAVQGFVRDTLPLVRARQPTTQFHIVGRAPVRDVMALTEQPGVNVTGEVADVRPFIATADVVVAPLRQARGVQNKVLEAMAMARPVVASRAAATGIEAQEGLHWLIANQPADEARHIIHLLSQPVVASAMGQAARAHMIASYSWDVRLAPLRNRAEQAVAGLVKAA